MIYDCRFLNISVSKDLRSYIQTLNRWNVKYSENIHTRSLLFYILKENYKIKGKSLKLQDIWSLCEFSHYEESVELIFLCNWYLYVGWILGLGGNQIGEVYSSGKKSFSKKISDIMERLRLTGKENVWFSVWNSSLILKETINLFNDQHFTNIRFDAAWI